MSKRRICVVTGSRADYGLLRPVMRSVERAPELDLQVAVTGMHLSPDFGMTVEEIEKDGFAIAARVDSLLPDDSGTGIAGSIARGVVGFAETFDRLKPDLVVVLGDRYEILAAATAALVQRIPIAHLCGGDVTEGAYDEAIRHSLTKMASLHFVTNEKSRRRVIQLGEPPERVHLAGSPGLDELAGFEPIPRDELAARFEIDADRPWLLATFHPVTRESDSLGQFEAFLAALETLVGEGYAAIVTQSNADNEGRVLAARLAKWAKGRDEVHASVSLGQKLYLSAMANAAAVVGNSSSGLYEAPSFKAPTVNIGTRQSGRLKLRSVVDCSPEAAEIVEAVGKARALDLSGLENPYGDGHAAERIVRILAATPDYRALLAKSFHDVAA